MSISIKLNNGNWYSDYIFLYDSYSYYRKNKYPLDSYNMGGGIINKYHILTIDETINAIEDKKELIKKQIQEKEKVLSVIENLYYKYTEKMKALYNDLLEECKKDSNRIAFNCIREAIENTKIEWQVLAMTMFNIRYTPNGINVYNYDYNYDHMFIFYTKKEIEKKVRETLGLKYKRGVVFQW